MCGWLGLSTRTTHHAALIKDSPWRANSYTASSQSFVSFIDSFERTALHTTKSKRVAMSAITRAGSTGAGASTFFPRFTDGARIAAIVLAPQSELVTAPMWRAILPAYLSARPFLRGARRRI